MNRPRKSKGPYPPCFYAKHGAFYLVKANKWTRLGSDLSLALAEYGRLMGDAKAGGMVKLIERTLPTLKVADSTRAQYAHAAVAACEGAALALDAMAARLRQLGTTQADEHADEAEGAAGLARDWQRELRA